MKTYSPDYYAKFRCAAAECKDSCCRAGWLIPLDEKTEKFYRSCGIDVDSGTEICPDGDRVFRLAADGSCVYLRGGLCELYCRTSRQGEVCAKYPRFFEEYDGFTEAGISASCPVAAKMILESDGDPYGKIYCETAGEPLLDFLVKARKKALDRVFILHDPDRAAGGLLDFGERLQELIDFDELGQLERVEFCEGELFPQEKIRAVRKFLRESTEPLSQFWSETLPKRSVKSGSASERRNYLAYLIYRRFLKAVNSEYIAAECRYIAVLYQLAAGLLPDYAKGIKLISREIEHDSENVAALLEFLG